MYRSHIESLAMMLNYLPCMIVSVSAIAADTSRIVPTTVAVTTSPRSIVTPPPAFHAELFKRAAATCGFLRGDSASPLTCQDDFNCATTAHAGVSAFACCNNIECLDDWGICLDFGSQYNCESMNLAASACSSIYGSILSCSSNAPNCYRYARSTSRGAFVTQYSWACGSNSTDVLVLQTATNGPQAPASTTVNPFAYTPAAYTPSSSNYYTPTKSGLTTRTIVMIVIFGGGALFTLAVIALICCQRRRKNKRIAAAQANLPSNNNQQQQPQQPPPPYPPPMANNPPPFTPPTPQPQPWASPVPTHPLPNEMGAKPPGAMSTVQELNAPVRQLYEMPTGQYPHPGGPPR